MPPPLTLPRRTLHSFRLVLKKHLSLKGRDAGPPVHVHAGTDGGTRVTTIAPDGRGVSFGIPGNRPPADLVLPFNLLADAGAAKAGDIALAEADGGAAVVANWDERGVPRSARGTTSRKDRDRAAAFAPPAVEELMDPGPGFATALRHATASTDTDSGRYALGCVRLDPHAGWVEATDSHCLLIARGFSFPWEEPVLLPAPHALGCSQVKESGVRVARVTDGAKVPFVVLSAGDWTLWAPEARDARFPDLDRVVPGGPGLGVVSLSAADAAFLADRLDRLPGAGDERRPVTLEVRDGAFLVRAAEEGGEPVELATASSDVTGEAIAVADRRFLARALAAGCSRIAPHGPEEPVCCDTPGEGGTTVVFATLAGESVAAEGAVRLAAEPSPAPAAVEPESAPPSVPFRTPSELPAVTRTRSDAPAAPAAPAPEALIERTAALTATLSDAAAQARSLAADLRKLKKRDREVSAALGSLKRLGNLAA